MTRQWRQQTLSQHGGYALVMVWARSAIAVVVVVVVECGLRRLLARVPNGSVSRAELRGEASGSSKQQKSRSGGIHDISPSWMDHGGGLSRLWARGGQDENGQCRSRVSSSEDKRASRHAQVLPRPGHQLVADGDPASSVLSVPCCCFLGGPCSLQRASNPPRP